MTSTRSWVSHHVIYVPGIGDTKTTLQELAVKTWRLYGVVPHTFPMRWADKEAFEPKLERLLAFIDEKLAAGHKVSLVGASAGAGVVLNAFARRHNLTGVVCIAGKVNRPEAIGGWYRHHAPAFVESAHMVKASLRTLRPTMYRKRIISRYAIVDHVVPKVDSVIAGARNQTVPSAGHATTIATQLIFGAPWFIRQLRRL